MKYTIDAKGKSLGRTATEVAMILMGKNSPAYNPSVEGTDEVEIINASKVRMSPKQAEVLHERYSGYPGGFKTETAGKIAARKGYGELFKLAVYGMLPANKLRPRRMKRLSTFE